MYVSVHTFWLPRTSERASGNSAHAEPETFSLNVSAHATSQHEYPAARKHLYRHAAELHPLSLAFAGFKVIMN